MGSRSGGVKGVRGGGGQVGRWVVGPELVRVGGPEVVGQGVINYIYGG